MNQGALFISAAIGMLAATQAQALTLGFSAATSDDTDPALLDAEVNYSVTSTTGNDLLTLTIDNLTTDDANGYTISEFYFNFTGDYSLFSLQSSTPSGASLSTDESADGFGTYDVKLDLGAGNDGIAPMATGTYGIDLGGTGFSDTDFEVLSSTPPGEIQALAALFFTQGPGDDSAFSIPGTTDGTAPPSTIPVPGAVWLFGSGLIGLIGVARRRIS